MLSYFLLYYFLSNISYDLCNFVTESKLVLCTMGQTKKSGNKVLGQGRVTLAKKPENQEDGRLMLKDHLTRGLCSTFFYKRKRWKVKK